MPLTGKVVLATVMLSGSTISGKKLNAVNG